MNRRSRALARCFTLTLLALPAPAQSTSLEVRFYPERSLYLHPLEDQRGIESALLQNAAVINRGTSPLTLESLTFELLAGEAAIQTERLQGDVLTGLGARSGQLAASGMLELFAFHFRPDLLLAGAAPSGGTTLAPGAALLLGHRAFLIQETAINALRLSAVARATAGERVEGRAELAIVRRPPTAGYTFPLAGTWFVGAGASLHSHHRWAVPEEFALDLLRVGENGRTFRGDGKRLDDYLAWEAPVRAVADGTVVRVVDRFEDGKVLRREPGEAPQVYLARVQQAQVTLFAEGPDAITGNAVVLEHANGEFSFYAHLRRGSVGVKVGDRVKRGQVIGKLGNSGNSTEPHLHVHVTNGPDPLRCAGLPVAFEGIELPIADLPRALQTGDVVIAE